MKKGLLLLALFAFLSSGVQAVNIPNTPGVEENAERLSKNKDATSQGYACTGAEIPGTTGCTPGNFGNPRPYYMQ